MKFRINNAVNLLARIGGTARMVAGVGGVYWPDQQTPKKVPKRPLNGRGNYGAALMAHFDRQKFAAKKGAKA